MLGVQDPLTSGSWVREGKGKNATETFVTGSAFNAGDAVVIRGVVSGADATLSGAVVEVTVSGPGGAITTLTSAPSDTLGRFEVTWQTQAPNKKGSGGTDLGAYSASLSNATLEAYSWDGVATAVGFTLE